MIATFPTGIISKNSSGDTCKLSIYLPLRILTAFSAAVGIFFELIFCLWINHLDFSVSHIYNTKKERRLAMKKDHAVFIHSSLGEAKDFAKAVRRYLYEVEKKRALTEEETELWNKTHDVHVHTDDARLMIQEKYKDIY